MSVVLTVVFRDPARSLTEMCADEDSAFDAVRRIATNMGGYVEDAPSVPLPQGWIMKDVPTSSPITLTKVVAEYNVESAD